MKTPVTLSTLRSGAQFFPNGSKGYILDTRHERQAMIMASNHRKYGRPYSPGQWLAFSVTENAEGAFVLKTEKPTYGGHTKLTVGQAQPTLLMESEMQWVLDVVRQLGTDYQTLRTASASNEAAFRLVAFLENAYHWTAFQSRSVEDPWFDKQQFLDALTPLLETT